MGSRPGVEGDELHSSRNIHLQFSSVSDYAESLRLMTSVVFLFRLIRHLKSALSETMDNISLCPVISLLHLNLALLYYNLS